MPPLKAAPTKKSSVTLNPENSIIRTISTRSYKSVFSVKKENVKEIGSFSKRKAASPIKGNSLKRSALGNITNAIETKCVINSGKKPGKKAGSSTVTKHTIATTAKICPALSKPLSGNLPKPSTDNLTKPTPQPVISDMLTSLLPPLPKSRLKPQMPCISNANASVASLKPATTTIASEPAVTESVKPTAAKKPVAAKKCRVTVKPRGMVSAVPNTRRSSGRRSTLDSSESSLYVSALSDVLDDITSNEKQKLLPEPLINIDEEYINDPHQCAIYAYDIFEYLKTREDHFKIKEYMEMQTALNQNIRSILINWMVEIQESFELNHETLYLGIKLVDTYLSKVRVSKGTLQLVGATSMLIAAKYDERIPPSIEDFLYICNEAYKHGDMIKMEFSLLRAVDFELGFPLSYRFLRRYARCAKVPISLLTLARFILEFTLMDYSTISLSESKLAAAALYLAFKMKKEQEWDDTLIHFSGYTVKDFIDVVYILNNSIHQKPRQSLSTVRNKYSHEIFYGVAKIPLLDNEQL